MNKELKEMILEFIQTNHELPMEIGGFSKDEIDDMIEHLKTDGTIHVERTPVYESINNSEYEINQYYETAFVNI